MFKDQRPSIIKMIILPKLICGFSIIFTKSQLACLQKSHHGTVG